MTIVSQKELHAKLTKAFTFAFTEAQKRGIDVRDFHWFQSERTKDSQETLREKRIA